MLQQTLIATFRILQSRLYAVNPCLSVYNIIEQCPVLRDVLDDAVPYCAAESTNYFNRTDVKNAINAQLNVDWSLCSTHSVFVGGNDTSADPIQIVLPRVIEVTEKVLISNGDWDMLIPTNGTLLAIQAPSMPIVIMTPDDPYFGRQGIMGIQHFERGLMWAETFQAGHQQPEFQPRVALQHLMWLLGQIETL